jgi:hypothetical protein
MSIRLSRAIVFGDIFSSSEKHPQFASIPRLIVIARITIKKRSRAAALSEKYRIFHPMRMPKPNAISTHGRYVARGKI